LIKKLSSNFHTALPAAQKISPWVLWLLRGSPLFVLMLLGTYTRYLADDYSTSSALASLGFWKAQTFWYQAWLGRYAFTFLVSLVELAGLRLVPWLPLSGLLAWGAILFWTLGQLFRVLEIQIGQAWIALLVNLIIFGTIRGFREYGQVIFWQTGILTYQISLIIITLMVGIFLRRFYLAPGRPLRIWEYLLWFLAFFIGGGFSETWVIIQIAMLGLGLIGFFFTNQSPVRNNGLWVLGVGFVASWLALWVIARSPGNMNRDTVMAELSFNLLRTAVLQALREVPLFLSEWVTANLGLATLLCLAGLTVGICAQPAVREKAGRLRLGLSLLVSAYLLMWAGFIPQYAVMGIRPAERAIFMPMYLLVWVFVLCGVFVGAQLSVRLKSPIVQAGRTSLLAVLVLLLLWSPLRSAYSLSRLLPSLQLYAQLWDERDQFFRQQSSQGVREVVVPSLRRNPALQDLRTTFWLEGDLQEVPENWINQAAAAYYGLTSITGRK